MREREWEREREGGKRVRERERNTSTFLFLTQTYLPSKRGEKSQKSPLPLLHFLKIHQADLLLKQ